MSETDECEIRNLVFLDILDSSDPGPRLHQSLLKNPRAVAIPKVAGESATIIQSPASGSFTPLTTNSKSLNADQPIEFLTKLNSTKYKNIHKKKYINR